MPRVALLIGPARTLTAAVIYALPARQCLLTVQQSGGTIEQSNDGTTFTAITLSSNGNAQIGAQFIRAVTTNAIVTLKAA